MSEQHIRQIMDRLSEQDKKLDAISKRLDPIAKLYDDSNGFARIALSIMKVTLILSGVISALYGLLWWLKN